MAEKGAAEGEARGDDEDGEIVLEEGLVEVAEESGDGGGGVGDIVGTDGKSDVEGGEDQESFEERVDFEMGKIVVGDLFFEMGKNPFGEDVEDEEGNDREDDPSRDDFEEEFLGVEAAGGCRSAGNGKDGGLAGGLGHREEVGGEEGERWRGG